MSIKYSVLMSVYCKENSEFLRESLNSMINQTVKPDQIVVVKDGVLTKELDDTIDEYKNKYFDLFTIVELKENVGLGSALNIGLSHCRNEIIARMDSDDISIANRCEIQINELIKNEDIDIIGSFVDEFIDEKINIVSTRKVPLTHEEIYMFSKRRNPFNHPSVMYRKSKVLQIGGYPNRKRGQDMELFAKMLNQGCKGKNIDKALVLFRTGNDAAKRRKSWNTTKNKIELMYSLWKSNISSFNDFIIVSLAQLFVFICPIFIQDKIYSRFLRN